MDFQKLKSKSTEKKIEISHAYQWELKSRCIWKLYPDVLEPPDIKNIFPKVRVENSLQEYVNREQLLQDNDLYDQAFSMPSKGHTTIFCMSFGTFS